MTARKVCDCNHRHTARRCTDLDSYGVRCTCTFPTYQEWDSAESELAQVEPSC